MRNKLAELLSQAEGQINNDLPSVEQIADYLIDHGVIVPPCKVGDKIYILNRLNTAVNEAVVKAMYFTEDKKYHPKPHVIFQYNMARGRLRVNFSSFGKTVFLAKEEAEKALAERSRQ